MSAASSSVRLDIRGVSRRYGRMLALDDVSLSLSAGEILAVLGDSGCGKSTLLRLVAGLDEPDAGEIHIDGRRIAGRGGGEPPETRGVGLMFQDYALFPHLTVLANVRFGLSHLPGARARTVARERLAEVGLAGRETSYPATLSGGEAQRVALARALAPRPRVLLLDEPFSNLDAGTRERVRADTLAVLRQDGISAILVTHDAAEAVEFADRIALMRKGRLIQCDTAEALYRAPVSPFAARALGDIVTVAGLASGGRLATPLGTVALPSSGPDGAVQVCLRPEAIRIVPRGEGVPGRVLRRNFAGGSTRIDVEIPGLDEPLRLTAAQEDHVDDRIELGLVEGRILVFAECESA
ncbi:iron ABC transporter ATP-binding protein [Methylorubrum extorquens]|uniref:ABC transporter ATP-binding protein n=1 Tax=Methylorubrum extorquens TaxID=408 RepID=UPI0011715161|nr:ABC transporter ATP-binding protein [Methylorubrum extorquens]GEL44018.1 iron ABC transporter ATP-binding protein [Methylorubrum extorquens]